MLNSGPLVAVILALIIVAGIALTTLWLHRRRDHRRSTPSPPSALTSLETHGTRLRALHVELGQELKSWETVEDDVRRRILAADAQVQIRGPIERRRVRS